VLPHLRRLDAAIEIAEPHLIKRLPARDAGDSDEREKEDRAINHHARHYTRRRTPDSDLPTG
jgi:hypothetical protein